MHMAFLHPRCGYFIWFHVSVGATEKHLRSQSFGVLKQFSPRACRRSSLRRPRRLHRHSQPCDEAESSRLPHFGPWFHGGKRLDPELGTWVHGLPPRNALPKARRRHSINKFQWISVEHSGTELPSRTPRPAWSIYSHSHDIFSTRVNMESNH